MTQKRTRGGRYEVQGSSALRPEFSSFTQDDLDTIRRTFETRDKAVKAERRPARRVAKKAGVSVGTLRRVAIFAVASIVVFSVTILYIFQCAVIAGNARDIHELQAQLKQEKRASDDLRLDIARNDNIHQIQRIARANLGMDYPVDTQLRTVSLPELPPAPITEPVLPKTDRVGLLSILFGQSE